MRSVRLLWLLWGRRQSREIAKEDPAVDYGDLDDSLLSALDRLPRLAVASIGRACFVLCTERFQEPTINTNFPLYEPASDGHDRTTGDRLLVTTVDEDQLVALLPDLLRTHWQLQATSVRPLGGGMNSATAVVTSDDQRWVAKWVAGAGSAGFLHGARIASRLADAGLRSGRPLPTVDGELVAVVPGGALALLAFVHGRELTAHISDQPRQAETLARAHSLLGTVTRRSDFFDWLGDEPGISDVADWALPAIKTVVAEYRALPPLTWGTVHADPSPEAFILDENSAEVGIIDWSGAGHGPLLYDVASAVMYLGGTDKAATFLSHYARKGPVPADELDHHLNAFRRFRAIVQADYFARRILNNDLTGIDDDAENHKGLNDARRMLGVLGVI